MTSSDCTSSLMAIKELIYAKFLLHADTADVSICSSQKAISALSELTNNIPSYDKSEIDDRTFYVKPVHPTNSSVRGKVIKEHISVKKDLCGN